MRYLILLLLSSCVSDVWSDNNACDAFTDVVNAKAEECGQRPSRNLREMCHGRIITNNDRIWSECIPAVQQATCDELLRQEYCQPEGLRF